MSRQANKESGRVNERALRQFYAQCTQTTQRPVVVLGATVNALSYVRSLSRRGIPVLVAHTSRGIAGRSRYGSFFLIVEQSDDDHPGAIAADSLFQQLESAGLSVVALATSDAWQVYLSQRLDKQAIHAASLTPSMKVIDLCVDKQRQYEFAQEQGIAVPEFANAGDVHANRVSWSQFPAILKPRWAHVGRDFIGGKVMQVESAAALQSALDSLHSQAIADEYIVQRIISGGDDCLFAYVACYDQDGREFCSFIKRKLRQHPRYFGDGSYDVTCEDDGLGDIARRLLKPLLYQGVVGIEFKRNEEENRWELIEINPRAVSTIQISVVAGIDIPWYAYQLAKGDVVSSAPITYRSGVAHINGERDFRSFYARWRAGDMTIAQWLKSVWRAESHAVWDRHDMYPFLCCTAAQVLGKLRSSKSKQRTLDRSSSPELQPQQVPQALR